MPNGFGGPNVLLFLLALAMFGLVLKRRRRPAVRNDVPSQADAVCRRIGEMEVRLYGYAREVEAVQQTRIAALRALIDEADAAAARLAAAVTDAGDPAVLPFDEAARTARLLRQAGYSDEQVEKLIDRRAA